MTKGIEREGPLSIAIFADTQNIRAAQVAAYLSAEITTAFGPRNEAPLSIIASSDDAVVGGLNGAIHWSWFYIRNLWVRADWRGRGLGHRLLAEAEQQARARHCMGLYVDTFDAGAAIFYEKAGFERFGRISDFPPGHTRTFLLKRLTPA